MSGPNLSKVNARAADSNTASQIIHNQKQIAHCQPPFRGETDVGPHPLTEGYRDDCPRFDQRPGELEATRGLAPVAIGFRPDGGLWRVRLLMAGLALTDLTVGEARELAEQLLTHARVCERGNTGEDPLA